MSGLGERVQERLSTLGLSARAASLRAGLGPDAVRTILDGRSQSPRAARLHALAEALECDAAYLLGEDASPDTLAGRIRLRLLATGLNPFSAAAKAGFSRDYIRNFLRGKSASPRGHHLYKLATVLETNPEWLLFGSSSAAPVRNADESLCKPAGRPGGSEGNGAAPSLSIINGRVTLDIKANVSMGVAGQILALIEGDKA